jgi:hypothetical protein
MKKTAFFAGVFLFVLTSLIHAQTDSTKSVQPATHTDQWNNYSPDKYKMLPMPAPMTTEQIFPIIGHYNVTAAKDGGSSNVTITLDESNKGIAWVEGLPQGKFKAYLKKSPGTFKIPMQKTADNKDLPEGVLLYNKDANTLDVCVGCAYNNDDPGAAFTVAEPPMEEHPATTKSKKATAKAKVIPVKTWKYSGTKVSESTASVSMQ